MVLCLVKGGIDMNDRHSASLAIRRNNDGSYSVIDTRVVKQPPNCPDAAHP